MCVPVPVHYRRFRRRGYNQAAVLSRAFSELTGIPVSENALVRVHHRHSQIGQGRAARFANMAFKMRFWNIGGEGQILVGAISCSYIAIHYGDTWPHWLLITVMFLAGCIGGGLYGLIPAIFKAKWGTNETLFTLMLNYIALNFITYLQYQPAWQMPGTTFPKIRDFAESTRIGSVLGVHVGWIIALVLAVLLYLYFAKTKQGYEVTVVGESTNTARYAGMRVPRIILRTMFISGAICGFAGFLQVAGADGTLTTDTAGGAGFTAITVAWLSGMRHKPIPPKVG